MENASKALIIAGSILLSILIIALGMYIFSTSSSTSDVQILNETEIQTFNAKFEKYKGDQLGSNVQALINAIRSNASANRGASEKNPGVYYFDSKADAEESSTTYTIKCGKGNLSSGDELALTNYTKNLTNISEDVQNSHKYNVEIHYDKNGLIDAIAIRYTKGKPKSIDWSNIDK